MVKRVPSYKTIVHVGYCHTHLHPKLNMYDKFNKNKTRCTVVYSNCTRLRCKCVPHNLYDEFAELVEDEFWLYSLQSFTSCRGSVVRFVFYAPKKLLLKETPCSTKMFLYHLFSPHFKSKMETNVRNFLREIKNSYI